MSPPKKYWISENEEIPHDTMDIFKEYLLSLKLENKAEATVSKYRSIIEKFLTECSVPIEDLTATHVLAWLNQYSIHKKPKTVDLVLASLSSFFTFCLEEEYMENIVVKNRWRPKIPHALPALQRLSVEDEQVKKLYESTQESLEIGGIVVTGTVEALLPLMVQESVNNISLGVIIPIK
ncbi:phage integrase N-terminal SAM-like domain-containing protein [Psychrobacillus sp. FSL H8-0487]|uniref:phage integrase N-terminal SAM-like domain-containing protein n=1 Tax=Psychrobacillus sp. FSL H8-0487 TaxID=2921391 RepID=UPI0030F9C63B